MIKEFKAFVLRGNVVDLAVGVVIGAAFSAIIQSFVKNLINPLIALATPAGSLAEKSFCVGTTRVSGEIVCAHRFVYGEVISAMIQFVIIAAVIFFFVVKPLNHLMAKLKGETPTDEVTRECPECISRIPVKARRCAFCTAEVAAEA